MDDITYLLDLAAQEESEDDEEERRAVAAAVIVIYVGAEEARLLRAERRHPSRLYLCRPQLLPNPRVNTPWQRLYNSNSDRAYITTMGFDVATFNSIIVDGFGQLWDETPVPREDVEGTAAPRPRARSLDAAGALGLVLHYLNSTMREISLQQIFAIIPSTVSRYITFGLDILIAVLRTMPDTKVAWFTEEWEFEEHNALVRNRHPLLTGAFASIDGLNLPVQTSNDADIENATYNGWLSEHFISSVLVFSSSGIIIAANLNAPGSWHDSRVAQPIYEKLRTQTPEGYYLVADTAFPRGTGQIAGRIRAPLKSGQRIPGTPEEVDERMAFDRQLLSYRQTAEWGNRSLQGSFGRLRVPLEIKHTARRANLLETVTRLHNLRARRVGLNQIRTVYMKEWRANEVQERIWSDFENLLFADQRKNDRVSHFHMVANYE